MEKIYLDACLVIDLVERHPQFYPILRARIVEHRDATFCVSALTRLEVLTGPLRQHDDTLVRRFEAFLGVHEQLPLDDDIVNAALAWRVSGLKTPDAFACRVGKTVRLHRLLDQRRSIGEGCARLERECAERCGTMRSIGQATADRSNT